MTNDEPLYERTFIREWREHRGISQIDLAKRVQMDRGNLSKLEAGKHPYNQRILEPIARELDVTVDTLITRRPSDPIPFAKSYLSATERERRQIDAAAEAILKANRDEG